MKAYKTLLILFFLCGFTSCADKNEDVAAVENNSDPIQKIFKATNITNLESEVSTTLSTSFKCSNKVTFDECYVAAERLYLATTTDTTYSAKFSYALPQTINVKLANRTRSKNFINLKFDNTIDETKKVLFDHRQMWTTNVSDIQDLENDFFYTTDIKLLCRVTYVNCKKITDSLSNLISNYLLPLGIQQVTVDNSLQVRLYGNSLVLHSYMQESDILSLFNQGIPAAPSNGSLKQLRDSLRIYYQINLDCSQTNPASCLRIGSLFLQAIKSENLSSSKLLKVAIYDYNMPSSTPEVLTLKSSHNLQIINKLLKAHLRKY